MTRTWPLVHESGELDPLAPGVAQPGGFIPGSRDPASVTDSPRTIPSKASEAYSPGVCLGPSRTIHMNPAFTSTEVVYG